MAEERPLFEELLDVALYAPLGAVLAVAEEIPKLAKLGRSRLEGQVKVAQMLGRFAVTNLRRRVEDVANRPSSRPAGAPPERAEARGPARKVTVYEPLRAVETVPDAEVGESLDAAELAIPGYDALAASQVVARLGGLAPEELEAVGRYESAHRRRRTILSRIAQLAAEGNVS